MESEAAQENPTWVRLYRDRVAEVWGRARRFDDPESADYLPPEERVDDPAPRDGAFHWPALPDYSLWEEVESKRSAESDHDEVVSHTHSI